MNNDLVQIYKLNNSLLQLVEDLQDAFNKRKILSPDLVLLCFFFTKAAKTASAVVRLGENYAEDAFVLTRTVFEIVVKCLYMLKDDSVDKARGFILYDNIQWKKQLARIITWQKNIGREDNRFQQAIEVRKAICDNIEKDYKIEMSKVNWPKKNLEQLSDEVGMLDIYYTFHFLSCLYVHTAPKSSQSFVSENNDGLSFDIKPNPELSETVLINLFDLIRRIVKEFDHRFNLGYQDKITQLEKEFEEYVSGVTN